MENPRVPRAFVDVVYPLIKLNQESLRQVLSESQLGAWQAMKSELQVVGEGELAKLRIVGIWQGGTIRYEVPLDGTFLAVQGAGGH